MCSKEVPKGNSEKHGSAVALFVLNSGSRASYALYFGILDRQESVTPGDMLCFFLCLCCRFPFVLRVYLWRGSAAELCSPERRWYVMLWIRFGSRSSPGWRNVDSSWMSQTSRKRTGCIAHSPDGKGCFILPILKK